MSIDFRCGACGKHFSLPDEFAGRRAKCKQCGEVLTVPSPARPGAAPAKPGESEAGLSSPLDDGFGALDLGMLEAAASQDATAAPAGGPLQPGPLGAPRSRKKGLSPAAWVAIGGGGAVVLLLIVAVAYLAGRGGGRQPPEADQVAAARSEEGNKAASPAPGPGTPAESTGPSPPHEPPDPPPTPDLARRGGSVAGGPVAGGVDDVVPTVRWTAEPDPPGETFEFLPGDKLSVPPLPADCTMLWPATASPFILLAATDFRDLALGVVDLRSGKPAGQMKVSPGFPGRPGAMTLSPDGKLVAATTGHDGSGFLVWSFDEKDLVYEFPQGVSAKDAGFGAGGFPRPRGAADAAEMARQMHDRMTDAASSGEGIFEGKRGGRGGSADISGIGFAAPDQLVVVRQSRDSGEAVVFSISERREIQRFLVPPAGKGGFMGEGNRLALSPGGRYTALVGNGALCAYELATGECVGESPLPGAAKKTRPPGLPEEYDFDSHPGGGFSEPQECLGMAFSPDGKELVAVFDEMMRKSRLRCWDFATGELLLEKEMSDDPGDRMRDGGAPIQWTPDGSAWIYRGKILVDRGTGEPFWRLPIPDKCAARMIDSERILVVQNKFASPSQLVLSKLPKDKVARAVEAVESGGSGIDAALAPLTQAKVSESRLAALGADADTWSAHPDPAVVSAALPERALQLGQGTSAVKSICFARDAGQLAVLRGGGANRSMAIPGRNNPGRLLESYRMPDGESGPPIELPVPYDLLDVSPEGTLALLGIQFSTRSSVLDKPPRDRLDIWSLATGKPAVAWRPYGNQSEAKDRDVLWARFTDKRHALTLNRPGELVLWEFPECKAIYVVENVGTVLAMSPGGKYVAVKLAQEGTFRLVETATGKYRGKMQQPGGMFRPVSVGFRRDGTALAAAGVAKVVTWDLADGKVKREFDIPPWHIAARSTSGELLWFGDRHLLLANARLLDLDAQIIAWSYQTPTQAVANVGLEDRYWFCGGAGPAGSNAQYLTSAPIPSDQVLRQIAGVRLEDIAIVYPGVKVSVHASLPGQDSRPIVEALKSKLEANGAIVEQNAKVRASITGETSGTGEQLIASDSPLSRVMGPRGDDQVFEQKQITCTLRISDQQGRESKISTRVTMRASGDVSGNNAQQELMKELQESAAQVAQQLRIPKYVLPDGANAGLGVSQLSLQGEAITVNKAQIVQ